MNQQAQFLAREVERLRRMLETELVVLSLTTSIANAFAFSLGMGYPVQTSEELWAEVQRELGRTSKVLSVP